MTEEWPRTKPVRDLSLRVSHFQTQTLSCVSISNLSVSTPLWALPHRWKGQNSCYTPPSLPPLSAPALVLNSQAGERGRRPSPYQLWESVVTAFLYRVCWLAPSLTPDRFGQLTSISSRRQRGQTRFLHSQLPTLLSRPFRYAVFLRNNSILNHRNPWTTCFPFTFDTNSSPFHYSASECDIYPWIPFLK